MISYSQHKFVSLFLKVKRLLHFAGLNKAFILKLRFFSLKCVLKTVTIYIFIFKRLYFIAFVALKTVGILFPIDLIQKLYICLDYIYIICFINIWCNFALLKITLFGYYQLEKFPHQLIVNWLFMSFSFLQIMGLFLNENLSLIKIL